jgi:hypothetical protein
MGLIFSCFGRDGVIHEEPFKEMKFPNTGLWQQSNSNLEIRNSKQIQNANAPMPKTETHLPTVLVI